MKHSIKITIQTFAYGLFSFVFASPVLAQGIKNANPNLEAARGKTGFAKTTIDVVAGNVINSALTLVGIIFLGLMVYAGFLWMTARGESEQIEKAKNIITAAIIGLVVVLGAYAVTAFVTTRFGAGA